MLSSVFTYGTLAYPEVMAAVTGRQFDSTPGHVTGFLRVGVRDAVYPGMIVAAGETTGGRVYREVDEATLRVLDRFEDWLYERHVVSVGLDGGGVVRADAWIVPERFWGELDGRPWDVAGFERAHLPDYLEMCRSFGRDARAEDEG